MRQRRRGRRSPEAQQRRMVNSIISRESHKDPQLQEAINVTIAADLYDALAYKFGNVMTSVLSLFEMGEVLIDGRGQGSMQREKQ